MNGPPIANGHPVHLVRAATCKNCKYREVEDGGVARCHFGPPQRSFFAMPQGGRVAVNVQVAFPEVLDTMFCHQHKPRVLTADDAAGVTESARRLLT